MVQERESCGQVSQLRGAWLLETLANHNADMLGR